MAKHNGRSDHSRHKDAVQMRVGVSTEIYEAIQAAAADEDRSISAFIRRAVQEYLAYAHGWAPKKGGKGGSKA